MDWSSHWHRFSTFTIGWCSCISEPKRFSKMSTIVRALPLSFALFAAIAQFRDSLGPCLLKCSSVRYIPVFWRSFLSQSATSIALSKYQCSQLTHPCMTSVSWVLFVMITIAQWISRTFPSLFHLTSVSFFSSSGLGVKSVSEFTSLKAIN